MYLIIVTLILILNAQIEVFRTNARGEYGQRITLANTLDEVLRAASWGSKTIDDFKTRFNQERDFQALKTVNYSITKTYWGEHNDSAIKIKDDFVWRDRINIDNLPHIIDLCILEHSAPSKISYLGMDFEFISNNSALNSGGVYDPQTEIEDKARRIILTEDNLHHWVRYKYISINDQPETIPDPNDTPVDTPDDENLPQTNPEGNIIFTPDSSQWQKDITVNVSLSENTETTVEASNTVNRSYRYRYITDEGENTEGTSSLIRAYTQTWEAGEIKLSGQNKFNREQKEMSLDSNGNVTLKEDGIWVLNGNIEIIQTLLKVT